VSYKGGPPGFVRALDDVTLAFPDYDGNGMFRSLGNLLDNPQVSMLFLDFERPRRLRVLGRATVAEDDPLLPTWEGAQFVVRVAITHLFPNCPRYIHRFQFLEASPYTPEAGRDALEPEWKARFRDVLPETP
jgi:uncharacterized protein